MELKKKINITAAGVPAFNDSKAVAEAKGKVDSLLRQSKAQNTNKTEPKAIAKMKSDMTSCQVTPGAWTTKNKI